jgi:hypothetical protein
VPVVPGTIGQLGRVVDGQRRRGGRAQLRRRCALGAGRDRGGDARDAYRVPRPARAPRSAGAAISCARRHPSGVPWDEQTDEDLF